MPRKPIGDKPMTDAERQARCRAARAAGKPVIRIRRPADLRSRAQRWRDAVAELATLQAQYTAWLEVCASSGPLARARCSARRRGEPGPTAVQLRCRCADIATNAPAASNAW